MGGRDVPADFGEIVGHQPFTGDTGEGELERLSVIPAILSAALSSLSAAWLIAPKAAFASAPLRPCAVSPTCSSRFVSATPAVYLSLPPAARSVAFSVRL